LIIDSSKYYYAAGAVSFDFQLSTRIIFGEGAVRRLSEEIKGLGKGRVLIVTSKGMSQRKPMKDILSDLDRAGIAVDIFASTPPEPSVEDAAKCLEFAKKVKPELVAGIGGGSAMDVAKKTALETGVPKIMIPTTAGSGSEVTFNSVLLVGGLKKSFSDVRLAADAAIVDPDLLTTLPPAVMVCSAMDAMAHAVESYGARKGNNITRALALEAYLLTRDNVGRALSGDAEGRRGIALGSLMAGMALTGTGTTLGHALAYPLSNRGMTHGQSLAAVLPHLLKINRFDADHADILKSLRRKYCSLPRITWDIPAMAEEVAADQRHLANNPVDVTLQQLVDLYTVLRGESRNRPA
jgi:alcohol dehydrogenase